MKIGLTLKLILYGDFHYWDQLFRVNPKSVAGYSQERIWIIFGKRNFKRLKVKH